MNASEQLARALGPRPGARVEVLGPCPGCASWQVDIADDVPLGRPAEVPSGPQGIRRYAAALARARQAMIEEALEEHAAECPPLAAIIAARAE